MCTLYPSLHRATCARKGIWKETIGNGDGSKDRAKTIRTAREQRSKIFINIPRMRAKKPIKLFIETFISWRMLDEIKACAHSAESGHQH